VIIEYSPVLVLAGFVPVVFIRVRDEKSLDTSGTTCYILLRLIITNAKQCPKDLEDGAVGYGNEGSGLPVLDF